MIYVTSDHHFFHGNILRHAGRAELYGITTITGMNNMLIERWNSVVKNNDEVYHLGDFSLATIKMVAHIVPKLNGRIYLVPGNHDKWSKKPDANELVDILPPIHTIKYNKIDIILCHYPMYSWNKSHHGSIQLHGHCHGGIDIANKSLRRYDVGVDANEHNLFPQSLDRIVEINLAK